MTPSFPMRDIEKASRDFEETYVRHVDMLYRVCFSYIKNVFDTEDIVADVFVKLLKHKKVFQDAEHEKAWLLRTAINQCKDYLKHWSRNCVNIDNYQNLKTDNNYYADETLTAILDLPERYKVVIYLYYYEGYSSIEIAKALKKPQSTILNHLHEGRKYLKGVLLNEE